MSERIRPHVMVLEDVPVTIYTHGLTYAYATNSSPDVLQSVARGLQSEGFDAQFTFIEPIMQNGVILGWSLVTSKAPQE